MIKSMDAVRTPTVGAWWIPAQEHRQREVCFGADTSGESTPYQVSDRTGVSETAPSATMSAQFISVSMQFFAQKV